MRLIAAAARGAILAILVHWGASFALFAAPTRGAAAAQAIFAPDCSEMPGARLWLSPHEPVAGRPLNIIAVFEHAPEHPAIHLFPERGPAITLTVTQRGGPPFSLRAHVPNLGKGRYRVLAGDPAAPVACRRIEATTRPRPRAEPRLSVYWPTLNTWDRDFENLYSAWIEHLFDAPPEEALAFRPLAQAIRDPSRNVLHNHLGLDEDDPRNRSAPRAEPDCADLPYFLRAYFAWKLGLQFTFRKCDRGTSHRAPRCEGLTSNDTAISATPAVAAFRRFERLLVNTVHSGSLRTALGDDETDAYPISLDRTSLRPGVLYADPFGHVLVLTRWISPEGDRPGRLLVVDGQPDASITRKRFWEGNFLFASDIPSSGAGWKTFRPVGMDNAALEKSTTFTRYSAAQGQLDSHTFHARMAAIINPGGVDANTAYDETLAALVEQLQARVRAIDNGEDYMRKTAAATIAMPEGANIFETTGPWEDFATPSRDMRLLIAMKVLLGLPERIEQYPALFRLEGRFPSQVRREIEARHARAIENHAITYTRSDGSSQRLTVAEILKRRHAFELAYNPNDCVEVRWGASPGTPEYASCARRAPDEQRARMEVYRDWFAHTRRPPR